MEGIVEPLDRSAPSSTISAFSECIDIGYNVIMGARFLCKRYPPCSWICAFDVGVPGCDSQKITLGVSALVQATHSVTKFPSTLPDPSGATVASHGNVFLECSLDVRLAAHDLSRLYRVHLLSPSWSRNQSAHGTDFVGSIAWDADVVVALEDQLEVADVKLR
jgi:hypothetical protein